MNVDERKITIREIAEKYHDDNEHGVVGYDGQLDIRPKYQREYVYKDKQRDEVIHTVTRGLPLSIMYWVDRGEQFEDDPNLPRYEVLDGQQRTISICQYVTGKFTFDNKFFQNLTQDQRDAILDYQLTVYVCSGNDSEKLDWFTTINTAGEPLTKQELRNAVYAGPWVSSAKTFFSKSNGAAYQIGSDYMKGTPIRQDYLEKTIEWKAAAEGVKSIEDYMAIHQNDPTAQQLASYFRSVIEWVQAMFPHYRVEMQGVPWGILYNQNHERTDLDPVELEEQVRTLMMDDEITKRSGIYQYVLNGETKNLNIRKFSDNMKRALYTKQDQKCAICGKEIASLTDAHADHIIPWSKGGKTTEDNCQILCMTCNLKKGAQE